MKIRKFLGIPKNFCCWSRERIKIDKKEEEESEVETGGGVREGRKRGEGREEEIRKRE